MIYLLLSQWQASKLSLMTLQSKLWHTFVSASSFVKDFGNPSISRVSVLDFWAFAQHCFSVLTKIKKVMVFEISGHISSLLQYKLDLWLRYSFHKNYVMQNRNEIHKVDHRHSCISMSLLKYPNLAFKRPKAHSITILGDDRQ